MPDRTPTAIKLLRPVKRCLGQRHSRRSKPDQGGAGPAGHMREVNVGEVQRSLHQIEKGCEDGQTDIKKIRKSLTLCAGEPIIFFEGLQTVYLTVI